jgi:hypothetical protein
VLPWLVIQFGMSSYDIWVETPFIGARNYHLECKAPKGLRVRHASLLDIENSEVLSTTGPFVRHVHLYGEDAQERRRALTWISLRPSYQGLLGTSALVAIFVVLGVVIMWQSPGKIADNPSAAPSLLLLLPGLIASVVGRPDPHALTTRVLAWVRRILLMSGLAAYVAAVIVGLSPKATPATRHDEIQHLQDWLRWPAYVAIVCCGLILLAATLNLPLTHSAWRWAKRLVRFRWLTDPLRAVGATAYQLVAGLQMSPDRVLRHVVDEDPKLVRDGGPLQIQRGPGVVVIVCSRQLLGKSPWDVYLFARAIAAPEGTELTFEIDYDARWYARPLVPLALRRRRRQLYRRLEELLTGG